MKLKLFNTREGADALDGKFYERGIREFSPLNKSIVRIYSCGPTVYNYAHIGNLSSYIYADILRRSVKLAGEEFAKTANYAVWKVEHVMNLTDVDDKTIRDSAREFPELNPMDALHALTEKYSRIFLNEMLEIGNDVSAILFTKATDNIAEIQDLIKKLLEENIAYTAEDGIYFSIGEYQKTRKYGQLSKISRAEDSVSRIANDEYSKENARDFALWKFAKKGDPSWDFSINEENFAGRPGWHIECSAMSIKNLGQPFDVHTGGVDLIFPHHENEIAQATAGDQPEIFANFFVHNEHLLIDGKKMSKSENNFYTLLDLKNKGFSALDFRMLVLQSNFRSATNFSWDNLIAAKSRLGNWKNFANLRWQKNLAAHHEMADFEEKFNSVRADLLNNLDTPNALAKIDVLISEISSLEKFDLQALKTLIDFIDEFLGLKIRENTPDITFEERELIRARENARDEKKWRESDDLRDELFDDHGLILKDTPLGTIWSRK